MIEMAMLGCNARKLTLFILKNILQTTNSFINKIALAHNSSLKSSNNKLNQNKKKKERKERGKERKKKKTRRGLVGTTSDKVRYEMVQYTSVQFKICIYN